MACNCKTRKEFDSPIEHTIRPDEHCLFCAEKHFSEAYALQQECGYNGINRHRIIGALVLAQWHLYEKERELAEHIRNLRHVIQNRRDRDAEELWGNLSEEIGKLIDNELDVDADGYSRLERGIMSGSELEELLSAEYRGCESFSGKIYIISNVSYPVEKAITPDDGDLLVFLNKAKSKEYYRKHKKKIVIHRSPERDYGDPVPGMRNIYLFRGKVKTAANIMPGYMVNDIAECYNYEYSVPDGKVKCPTTGYYAAKIMEHLFTNSKIILVNFGMGVKNSSYRYPAHNWEWEDQQLSVFEHVYTE